MGDILKRCRLSIHAEAHCLAERFGAPARELLGAQSKLDRFFLGSLSGGLTFSVIMLILVQSIATWLAPTMDVVETGVISLCVDLAADRRGDIRRFSRGCCG